ncbi:MAG: response regulator transcription factor [Actinobacteria bacterium]|nr:MAG: response regulator transcription factor [Actinomycetota bacterium]
MRAGPRCHTAGGLLDEEGVLMGPIRVVIVDDHAMVAESLKRLLEAEHDMQVVALAVNVAGAIEAARMCQPDVMVMDYGLPDGDGVSATTIIRHELPRMKVLLLTGNSSAEVVAAALDAGCVGYVEKTNAAASLTSAVRAVHAGEAVLPQAKLGGLLARGDVGGILTKRERDILTRVESGASNKAIAAELTVSLNTVRTHVQSILKKLGAHSKLQAVSMAREQGVLRRR